AVHDGVNVFFLLQVDGAYAYTKGESNKCPSVALMFQVGEKATFYNMGGCKDMPGSCTSKSCRGHEVDIMHFSIGNAIPGRLYGGNHIDNAAGNGNDRFGHLVDVYAWNPHCRYLDGVGPKENNSNAQNDWHGAWWHSSLTFHSGFVDDDNPYGQQDEKGTYYFDYKDRNRFYVLLNQMLFCNICNWLVLDIQPSLGEASSNNIAALKLPVFIVGNNFYMLYIKPSLGYALKREEGGSRYFGAVAKTIWMNVLHIVLFINFLDGPPQQPPEANIHY
ncbi:hypothetical protein ACJX0J_006543, partial [Zea mays]